MSFSFFVIGLLFRVYFWELNFAILFGLDFCYFFEIDLYYGFGICCG